MASRWNLLWALPWMLVSVLAVEILVFLPLYLLGLVVVPCAARRALKTERPSRVNDSLVLSYRSPALDALWGNWEDGLAPAGFTIWSWFQRNPCCNLRFCPVISTRPSAATRFIGSREIAPGCRFIAWAGPYVGCRWEGRKYGVWLGYKINPRDAWQTATDYRVHGLGIAVQILREQ